MDQQPPYAPQPEHFQASKRSTLNTTRLWLWLGGVIAIAIPSATAKDGINWFVTIFMLAFLGLLDWFLRSQMHKGQAYVSVDALGIGSPAFHGKTKRYAWSDIAEITLTRVHNAPMLQLVLRPSSGHLDKRSFWNGQNPARPALPLSALDEAQHGALLQAIERQRHGQSPHVAPPAVEDQLAQEKEFHARLKALAPIPWLTYGLIAINAAVWLVTLGYGAGFAGTPAELLLGWGGNAASEVQRGEWWRMASALFLHSGFMHVALNMLGLYSAGVTVERIYGHRLFALLYLGSGLMGSALSLHFSAQGGVSVGASGAVFGIMGALLVGFLQHRDKLPKTLGKQTLSGAGFFILFSLGQGFAKPGIDNAAHVGGLLAGCLLAYVLPERLDLEKFVRSYKTRGLLCLAITLGATAGVAGIAPAARVDQRATLDLASGMRAMAEAMQALQDEAQQVEKGALSLRESDTRSRTVFAPRMRQVLAELSKVTLADTDPRKPLLTDAKRMTELLLESLAMESVFPEGSDKPQPADPQRAADISKELTAISEHFVALQASLQNGKKR
ncbi:rhomboid family intramembrane serine protease [Rhodoferax saidenbachensis]|uniref:Rhomboid protease GluP n=1 Tax=Rhodoferax saidenbachensis TaxID=1484693 RepID=A0ABU1ZNB2_9BURK|nr:rhomboid family intramembrane serine protease [Rhodoferax saidenbachensis]MDR7307041.1 rhomboid protease GluP [Rhodoferax saidenbachensis]